MEHKNKAFVFNDTIRAKDLGGELHFEKGAVGAMHHHPHTQCSYVVSGAFEFTINGEKKVVRKGDTLYKLPNVEHGCVCLEEGVLLDFFTPMREDFVTE